MQSKEMVIQEAMRLSPGDRLEVAEKLLESVEGEPGADEAWAEEIARRLAAIDAGEATKVPWDEARRRIAE